MGTALRQGRFFGRGGSSPSGKYEALSNMREGYKGQFSTVEHSLALIISVRPSANLFPTRGGATCKANNEDMLTGQSSFHARNNWFKWEESVLFHCSRNHSLKLICCFYFYSGRWSSKENCK